MSVAHRPGLDYRHKEHPKTCAEDDYWGQVSRTVNGQPVDQQQIGLIVAAIESGLALQADDCLLDIACGNGALADRLRGTVAEQPRPTVEQPRPTVEQPRPLAKYLGVDFSSYLIEIARKHFPPRKSADGRLLQREYVCQDAAEFVEQWQGPCESGPDRFTKALCYGAFSYFAPQDAERLLRAIGRRFTRVQRLLIGNIPDRERAAEFFREPVAIETLDDPQSAIGIWRSQEQFRELAKRCGWEAAFYTMPRDFYAAHYRFDACLTRHA